MSTASAALKVREGTVSVGGASLFYKEAGTGSPLLLIHGGGPDSRGWSPIFEELARDHRVIAYDRRGYGKSVSAPLGGAWRRHGEDAAELLRALDATPAQVVAWSAGGYVAIDLATEHPELVRSLVLVETGLVRSPAATASFWRMVLAMKLLRLIRGDRAAIDRFMRWVTVEDVGTTWDRPEYAEERKLLIVGNRRGIWADFALRGRPDVSDRRLARIRCPVTCVLGAMGQPWFRRSAEVMLRSMPQAELVVVPGTNHAVSYHVPERVAEVIRNALGKARTDQVAS
ncbi:MAG: alpha/beta fold hydrolase [Polyangia bacterium]